MKETQPSRSLLKPFMHSNSHVVNSSCGGSLLTTGLLSTSDSSPTTSSLVSHCSPSATSLLPTTSCILVVTSFPSLGLGSLFVDDNASPSPHLPPPKSFLWKCTIVLLLQRLFVDRRCQTMKTTSVLVLLSASSMVFSLPFQIRTNEFWSPRGPFLMRGFNLIFVVGVSLFHPSNLRMIGLEFCRVILGCGVSIHFLLLNLCLFSLFGSDFLIYLCSLGRVLF